MRKYSKKSTVISAALLLGLLLNGCSTGAAALQTTEEETEMVPLPVQTISEQPTEETAPLQTVAVQPTEEIETLPPKQNPLWPDLAVGDFAEPMEPEGKVIYLTFDDGPNENTLKLLKILEEYDVKATFFVVDTPCIGYVSAIAEAGHTVALHSGSHKYREIYANETAYFRDLQRIQSVVCSYIGECPTMIRFPGGSDNTVSRGYSRGIMTRLTDQVKEMGYRYFD